jgi:hypothetical protein
MRGQCFGVTMDSSGCKHATLVAFILFLSACSTGHSNFPANVELLPLEDGQLQTGTNNFLDRVRLEYEYTYHDSEDGVGGNLELKAELDIAGVDKFEYEIYYINADRMVVASDILFKVRRGRIQGGRSYSATIPIPEGISSIWFDPEFVWMKGSATLQNEPQGQTGQ